MVDYMTRWGYSVGLSGSDAKLPPIIDEDRFSIITDGVLSSEPYRIRMVLDGVSQAVRDWCGWHVAPVLDCKWVGQGEGGLLLLPCAAVRSVSSLKISGAPQEVFEWLPSGLVRLKGTSFPNAWRSVECDFAAGNDAADSIGMVVAQIAANQLAATAGIRGERIGSASIDYNQTEDGVSGGVRLLSSDLKLLAPYRITAR